VVVRESVRITGDGVQLLDRKVGAYSDLPLLLGQAQSVADRCWTDLVSPHDYFYPLGQRMLRSRPSEVTDGSFILAFNPELSTIGDFISRSMLHRLETWKDCLARLRRLVIEAVRGRPGRMTSLIAQEQEAWSGLEHASSMLRQICFGGQAATLRESCIILTQVCAAFGPESAIEFLGLHETVIRDGQGYYGDRLIRSVHPQAVEKIAVSLGDLRRLPQNEAGALEMAISRGGLVLVENPRRAYWERKLIDTDWNTYNQPWQLLVTLAHKARHSMPVETRDLYDNDKDRALANVRNHLKNRIPASLNSAIEPVRPKQYVLRLDRQKVTIFSSPPSPMCV
jgi:hypothetical protein